MDDQALTSLIAEALRHDPTKLSLRLDEDGWSSIEKIVRGLNQTQPETYSIQQVRDALHDHNYNRFQIEENTGRVRAKNRHTTDQFDYDREEPPQVLFIAVDSDRYDDIRQRGLQAQRYKYRQVYTEAHEALEQGGDGLIQIQAEDAYYDGTVFYQFDGHWYIQEVPRAHLQIEQAPNARRKQRHSS